MLKTRGDMRSRIKDLRFEICQSSKKTSTAVSSEPLHRLTLHVA